MRWLVRERTHSYDLCTRKDKSLGDIIKNISLGFFYVDFLDLSLRVERRAIHNVY